MVTEIVVRISQRMFVEDVTALRSWLARRYPVGWTERRAAVEEHSLAGADLILTAILVGAGEAAAKAAVEVIREKIEQLVRRYPATEPPPATVETETTPEVTGDTEPPSSDAVEPVGPNRDAN